jgi:hypothetical protein
MATRARITHKLKCWPQFFQPTLNAHKRFEVRKMDRDYQVGDILVLQEWDPDTRAYSGREVEVRVDYLLKAFVLGTELPIDPEYCIMSISRLP